MSEQISTEQLRKWAERHEAYAWLQKHANDSQVSADELVENTRAAHAGEEFPWSIEPTFDATLASILRELLDYRAGRKATPQSEDVS